MRKDGKNEFQALFIAGPNAQVVLKKSAQTLLPLVLQLVATLPTEVADVCTGFTGMHAKVAQFVKKLVEFEHLNVSIGCYYPEFEQHRLLSDAFGCGWFLWKIVIIASQILFRIIRENFLLHFLFKLI